MVMSHKLTVHDSVYEATVEMAEERDITLKEAVRDVYKEANRVK